MLIACALYAPRLTTADIARLCAPAWLLETCKNGLCGFEADMWEGVTYVAMLSTIT